MKINKNDVIRVLEDSLEFSTRKNVTLDTIEVIKEYLEENELDSN